MSDMLIIIVIYFYVSRFTTATTTTKPTIHTQTLPKTCFAAAYGVCYPCQINAGPFCKEHVHPPKFIYH